MTEKKSHHAKQVLTGPGKPTTPMPAAKRGHYVQKECPFCHKMVGNLGNHVKQAHPTEASAQETVITKESLVSGKKPVSPAESLNVKYYCMECNGVVRKDEATCWQCGTTLNWEGIE